MDALTGYKNLLRELDKFESPTFTVDDFNYFFPVAISKYITDNYGDFDAIQKDLDDIGALVKYKEPLVFTSQIATLPIDYRHALGLEVKLKFIAETVDNAIGDEITVFPKRLKTNRKGYTAENAYQQPSPSYVTYQLNSSGITLYMGDSVEVVEGFLDYIKTISTVYLDPNLTSEDVDDVTKNTILEFPEYVCLEIIKVCRMIFLENVESPRYQTTLNDAQMSKQKE